MPANPGSHGVTGRRYRPDAEARCRIWPSFVRCCAPFVTGRSIEILYQSMNKVRPDPIWRRITPHAFGYDGFRWHSRAFCHLEHKFKDFLLPRILGVRIAGEPGAIGRRRLALA